MLDTKHKKIKRKVQSCYKLIKESNKQLESLRKECEHPETEKCIWQWGGPAHTIENATVCSVCGELLDKPYEIIQNGIYENII